MGEIQIMCDMYMDKAGILMLITMPKEQIIGSRLENMGANQYIYK